MSDATLGYGSVFQIKDPDTDTFVDLGEVFNITPPSSTVDQVDVTHMQSPGRRREFIDGLIDPGECSFEINYIPGSDADALLLAIVNTPLGESRTRECRIIYPNSVQDTFNANLQSYEPNVPTDDKMTATVTLKVTGEVDRDAAAAPANIVKPAISAAALTTGSVLTAYPGVWSGGPTFTYQWKNAGSNISGATSQTYTLVSGDSGDAITVTVTATNSEGSANATSAPVVGA